MTASFRAYIDEAGDEGFKFRKVLSEQSSSDWFVLSAFITRKSRDLETVKVIDKVRQEFQLHPRKHVHWKDLKHPQKIRYSQMIAGLQARAIAICVHKPSLLEPETFQERYRLYFYGVRFLLERISWLARDNHNAEKHGGDGSVEIVFSNRQGMSYEEMKDYFRVLKKKQDSGTNVEIDFSIIRIDEISTMAPCKSMGLQLADAVAGATFNALERDRYGNTEPRYFETVAPVVYRHKGSLSGYGLKIAPREAIVNLADEECLKWWDKHK